ncbi:beta-N-acetylglucosaminidase domain-containing protein [Micromonospora sp. MP36]|uniref:beta-N-acetylglucosaminidase domain-containing protein n=1 Tax=Micromonospora sp. MP36 TaxID=2604468 RepID=UPI001CA3385D|nr:beta-N-acetylglucosaminidase domain-containing protein [Micromonospora sp. MP36]
MSVRTRCIAVISLVSLMAAAAPAQARPGTTQATGTRGADIPAVSPVPQSIERIGPDVQLPASVAIVHDLGVDKPALDLVTSLLDNAGVTHVRVVPRGQEPRGAGVLISLGAIDGPAGAEVAAITGSPVPELPAEGYALAVGEVGDQRTVALAGADADGLYYAAQTLRQLVQPDTVRAKLPAVAIQDYPAMPLRGSIEGFYGSPWTHAERLDQLAFYGDVKMNTYVYAPKDDPYHRARWRDPYPADKLAELAELVDQARRHHVEFTFALSPGVSICYADQSDYAALVAKLQAMYDLGVRVFSIPLDDISYTRWNCAADQAAYGVPSAATAGRAQVELLNRLNREFIAMCEDMQPLQMVPTEYRTLTDSAYRREIRENLDADIEVMWTGVLTIPTQITVDDVARAAQLFGRNTFLWENYPVNDLRDAAGRLLLAPYQTREPGISQHLTGIVSNPMNQAAAGKIALFTIADFSWNDHAYDMDRSWRAAARYLTGGNDVAAQAVLDFADLNYATFTWPGSQPWLRQAPELRRRTTQFWRDWEAGDREDGLSSMSAYAARIAEAPRILRDAIVDPAFLDDVNNWLDATDLWGRALVASVNALAARHDGNTAAADALVNEARTLRTEAGLIRAPKGENRYDGVVKIGDGVLDAFLDEAARRIQLWDLFESGAQNLSLTATATASSTESNLPQFSPHNAIDGDMRTRWSSARTDDQWLQVEFAEPSYVTAAGLIWESACASAYEIQVSANGTDWHTAASVSPSNCGIETVALDAPGPVTFVRVQGLGRKTQYGYSLWELWLYGTPSSPTEAVSAR